ncbi:hypothetical protein [Nonomuraea sp. SBT364]|uniref:hypothetical protein n=1 Tax=Nonomuraea sp. SBT364 TaxID=1580530 RepID=UPI00069E0F20|nr:hypothetical protein [Nonomuraea sp. SBT364]
MADELPRLLRAAWIAVLLGAAFGAATSLVNAVSHHFADLDSRAATVSGVSPLEIVTVLLDSGWAWAGWAVAVGWLVTRTTGSLPSALTGGALTLLAATAAYSVMDTVVRGEPPATWYLSESVVWWVAAVVLGAPLGAIGACVGRSGVIGLLARLTVPVGASVQMAVLPPGRNEVIATVGQVLVWTVAAACIGFLVIRFIGMRRPLPAP